jgi:hypothetical protein
MHSTIEDQLESEVTEERTVGKRERNMVEKGREHVIVLTEARKLRRLGCNREQIDNQTELKSKSEDVGED